MRVSAGRRTKTRAAPSSFAFPGATLPSTNPMSTVSFSATLHDAMSSIRSIPRAVLTGKCLAFPTADLLSQNGCVWLIMHIGHAAGLIGVCCFEVRLTVSQGRFATIGPPRHEESGRATDPCGLVNSAAASTPFPSQWHGLNPRPVRDCFVSRTLDGRVPRRCAVCSLRIRDSMVETS